MENSDKTEESRKVALSWKNLMETDIGAALELLDDNVKFEVFGSTPLSGVYVGRDTVLRDLASATDLYVVQPKYSMEGVMADGDRAMVWGRSDGEGPYAPYKQRFVHLLKIRDGKIIEFLEFFDTAMVETALFNTQMIRA